MSDFLNVLTGSTPEQLLPFLVVVISIITLAFIAFFLARRISQATNAFPGLAQPQHAEKGVRQTAAVLFIDLRGFHKINENREPSETMEILNEFFESVGAAVVASGGWIDNYMGDGLMAVFGQDSDPNTGCLQALNAIGSVRKSIRKLNKKLHKRLGAPIQIGIGLHVGPLLIGSLGHSNSQSKRAVGPAVNIAMRLEEMSREKNTQAIVSIDVIQCAKVSSSDLNSEFVVLRDNNIPIEVVFLSPSQEVV